MTAGQRLREMRNAKGVTQLDASLDIGVSVSALAMYETDQRVPRDSIKRKLASYYKTSIEDLFYADDVTISDTSKESE